MFKYNIAICIHDLFEFLDEDNSLTKYSKQSKSWAYVLYTKSN